MQFSPRITNASLVFALALAGVGTRVLGFLDDVFKGDTVVLQSTDPWIHYRYTQALTRDLDQQLTHDPYLILPTRPTVDIAPLTDTTMALIVRMLFGADASDQEVGLVCAWMPPVAGALTIVLAYLVGLAVGGRPVGFTAAAVLALCPTLFFYNSRLGMADHHVLEVLFTTMHALALLCALGAGQSSMSSPSRRRAVLWSLVAGVFLLLYLWTWLGGAYWIFIVICFAAAQYCIAHLRGEAVGGLTYALLPGMLLASILITIVPTSYPLRELQISAMWSSTALIFAMQALSLIFARSGARRIWFPLTLLGLGLAGILVSSMADVKLLGQIQWVASLLNPTSQQKTVEEVLPIFLQDGAFSLEPIWTHFGTALPFALAGLLIVMIRVSRTGDASATFLLVWSLANFVAMCGQRRFAYYAAVNAALLVGVLVQQILGRSAAEIRAAVSHAPQDKGQSRDNPGTKADGKLATRPWRRWAAVTVLVLVFIPGLAMLPNKATAFDGPTAGWIEALNWLRERTPEPFGDSSTYYFPDRIGPLPSASQPDAYCVMSSWDCGYWITPIAQRTPCSNPSQAGASREGLFFTSRDPVEAEKILRETAARYVVLDASMVAEPLSTQRNLTSRFFGMAAWSGRTLEDFYEWFEVPAPGGKTRKAPFFHPAYFETMAVRLYAFGGQVTNPTRMLVVRYQEVTRGEEKIKRIVDLKAFASYDEAKQALAASPGSVLVSDHPLKSCIPIEELTSHRHVFDSGWTVRFPEGSLRPEVRIFEFITE